MPSTLLPFCPPKRSAAWLVAYVYDKLPTTSKFIHVGYMNVARFVKLSDIVNAQRNVEVTHAQSAEF